MKAKRMRNGKFLAIWIPVLAVVVALCIVLNVAADIFSSTLDTFLGRGDVTVTKAEGTEDWDTDYYTASDDATEASYTVANQIQDEGTVLLKNNGVLPLAKKSTVMPFGYRYKEPIYGQLTSSGSGKWVKNPVTPKDGLQNELTVDESAADKMSGTPEGLLEAPGTQSAEESGSALGGDNVIYEYDASIYNGVTKANNAVALVFIARGGQEGTDLKSDAYSDGTPHMLALTVNEKQTIKKAKEICGKVIVIFECSAPMELSPVMSGEYEADAIIYFGHAGERGFSRLGKILTGDVVPSGRTVDIYPADFTKDPSYANTGNYYYTNSTVNIYGYGVTYPNTNANGDFLRAYLEYQEGMYMGYRYYETAAALDEAFVYGELDGKGAIKTAGAVAYPFGYGLSYTSFEQSIEEITETDDSVTVNVKVENKGDYAGKEVVQLYYTAPYTELDAENKIEKPVVQLIAFEKTDTIAIGKSATVSLTIAKEDMASYSYLHKNPDGTQGCYMLEAGEYVLSLRANSHDVIDERSVEVETTVWYDGSDDAHIREYDKLGQAVWDAEGNATKTAMQGDFSAATNLFQDSTDYMLRQSEIMSRGNWDSDFLTERAPTSKEADATTRSLFGIDGNFDWENDPLLGNVEGSKVYASKAPTSAAANGLSLIDLRGKDYDDPLWDDLLDQIDWNNYKDIINGLMGCAYNSPALDDIGLPLTIIEDGVNGIKVQGSDNGYDMTKTATYGMMPLVAATWNVDLVYEMGKAIGAESLANDVQGLYGPAINLHRSPFCGRVFEYFSEDPLLSGKLAAAEISGAGDAGMTTYLKHFALNDQETNRANLMCVWADEQTMRELYFKPFEIAVKEAKMTIKYISDDEGTVSTKVVRACTGMMAAQMNIGGTPGHCNYALLTELLRNEWGFRGAVTSDYWFWVDASAHKTETNSLRDACFRAGCDIYLCISMPAAISVNDKKSATALNVYRLNIKNLCYTVVNSNRMQGMASGSIISYGKSPWQIWLIVADVVVGVLAAGLVVCMVLRTLDAKKRPENYKAKIKKPENESTRE